ncbi:MAG TPA: DUF2155 domain-containing protein [Candidatus Baltobacteraceae bacterium]|nr:DUF2155 domain-containing protein [Candidatus Baltobacteraceae bacterium]
MADFTEAVGGSLIRRLILVGLAVAVPLAAVALYFAFFAPPPPVVAQAAAGGEQALPPNHPAVAGTQGGEQHPQVSAPGRTLRVPDAVKGKWQAVKLQVAPKEGGAPQVFTVKLGGDAEVPGSGLTVHATEFLPALQVVGDGVTSASNEPVNPAALVAISEGGKEIFRGWLFGKFPDMQPFEHPKYRITLLEGVPAKS